MTDTSATVVPRSLPLLGRILIALLFISAGISKIGNPAGTQRYIAHAGLPLPEIGYILAVVVELGGGVLLLVGYRARLTAIALALFTVVVAGIFHHAFADQNQMIHFLKNIAIAGGLLQVVAFGAGAFSLDSRISAKKQRALA